MKERAAGPADVRRCCWTELITLPGRRHRPLGPPCQRADASSPRPAHTPATAAQLTRLKTDHKAA